MHDLKKNLLIKGQIKWKFDPGKTILEIVKLKKIVKTANGETVVLQCNQATYPWPWGR